MRSMIVPAAVDCLDAVQDFVERELEPLGCSPRVLMQISLAVEEIFVNIASYAYSPEAGEAEVSTELCEDPKRIVIRFLDGGRPFDPLAMADADTSPEALERRLGGLGILMVKKTMDAVTYTHENGKNILTIEKNLN